ncbi:MAG: hypothetical protein H0U76_14485 [Ktedonobacteraceae bacterium]|nr:hypothetical protein [Ktedonobacteraceae bacterium]
MKAMEKRQKAAKSGNDDLSDTQEKFLAALFEQVTIRDAAASAGIAERTARFYMSQPAFQAAYDQARRELTTEIRASLFALAGKATTGLHKLIDDPLTPHAVQLKAYLSVIERVVPSAEAGEVAPLQGKTVGLIDVRALAYLTNEELDVIEQMAQRAEMKRAEAEK